VSLDTEKKRAVLENVQKFSSDQTSTLPYHAKRRKTWKRPLHGGLILNQKVPFFKKRKPSHPCWGAEKLYQPCIPPGLDRSFLDRACLTDQPFFSSSNGEVSKPTFHDKESIYLSTYIYTSVLVQNTISLHDRLEKTSLFLCFRFHVFNQTHVCTLFFLRGVSLSVTSKEKRHFIEWYCSFPWKLISFLFHLVLVSPNVFAPFLKCSGPHGHCSISSWGQMEPIQFIYLFVSSNLQWKSQGS
jgi:hypothetical protein